MKYLLLVALALPCLSVAQINADTISKKVNVIEIETGLTMDANFTNAAQMLAEKSWEIAQMHKEIGQLVTGWITIGAIRYKFNILAKENKIRLTGEFSIDNLNLTGVSALNTSTGRVTNWGAKGSATKKSFLTMLELAQKIAPDSNKIHFLIAE